MESLRSWRHGNVDFFPRQAVCLLFCLCESFLRGFLGATCLKTSESFNKFLSDIFLLSFFDPGFKPSRYSYVMGQGSLGCAG